MIVLRKDKCESVVGGYGWMNCCSMFCKQHLMTPFQIDPTKLVGNTKPKNVINNYNCDS
jgi:hypothetical protein